MAASDANGTQAQTRIERTRPGPDPRNEEARLARDPDPNERLGGDL
jgi:hypothetical protein